MEIFHLNCNIKILELFHGSFIISKIKKNFHPFRIIKKSGKYTRVNPVTLVLNLIYILCVFTIYI